MQDDVIFEDLADDIFMTDSTCVELAPYGSFPVSGHNETSVTGSMAQMAETLCFRARRFLPSRVF